MEAFDALALEVVLSHETLFPLFKRDFRTLIVIDQKFCPLVNIVKEKQLRLTILE